MTSQHSILFLLLALALVRGMIYAAAMPPGKPPISQPNLREPEHSINCSGYCIHIRFGGLECYYQQTPLVVLSILLMFQWKLTKLAL